MSTILIWLVIIAVILFLFRNPIKEKFFFNRAKNYTIDDRYNAAKREREEEIDRLLSKMGKNGINDLSKKERERLDELSQK